VVTDPAAAGGDSVFTRLFAGAAMDNARRQILRIWMEFFRASLDGRTSPSSSFKKARSGERFPMRAMLNRIDELLWVGCSPARLKEMGCAAWCRMIDIRHSAVVSQQRALTASARWSIA
jgi:hypothetical protein